MVGVDRNTSSLTQALAAVLRAEQARRDISNSDLAVRTGLSVSTIQRMLKGKRDLSMVQLAAIAAALGMRPSGLMAEAERALDQQDEPTPAELKAARDRVNQRSPDRVDPGSATSK